MKEHFQHIEEIEGRRIRGFFLSDALHLNECLAAIEHGFVAAGQAGANADLKHPQRAEWEEAGRLLRHYGRLA